MDPHFQFDETRQIGNEFLRCLLEDRRLADFLDIVLPAVSTVFGTHRCLLIDYHENTDHFDLLHYQGYGDDDRYTLQRRMDKMNLGRALNVSEPYRGEADGHYFFVPLRFRDVLEALLVFETAAELDPNDMQVEVAQLVSRFLGLLMSSARLEINRGLVVDMNDLQRARMIQLSFLPRSTPTTRGCSVFGWNASSALVGGDYFDYFLEQGTLQGILADACGHGMAAALIMSNFRGLLQSHIKSQPGVDSLFDILNAQVHYDGDFVQYLTGVFFEYHSDSRRMRYMNAGHYNPIILSANGQARELPGGGPPLGMFPGSTYPTGEAELGRGETMILFTDGLVDVQSRSGEYFGIQRIVESVRDLHAESLENISQGILRRALDFSQDLQPEDDVTLLLLRAT